MFSHARPLGLLALSATLLMQPGAGSRAACPEDVPQSQPIDVDAWIGTHFKDPPAIVLVAPLFATRECVAYDRTRIFIVHPDTDLPFSLGGQADRVGNPPCQEMPTPLRDQGHRAVSVADADIVHFSDYAFSPEVAHLIRIANGAATLSDSDGQVVSSHWPQDRHVGGNE